MLTKFKKFLCQRWFGESSNQSVLCKFNFLMEFRIKFFTKKSFIHSFMEFLLQFHLIAFSRLNHDVQRNLNQCSHFVYNFELEDPLSSLRTHQEMKIASRAALDCSPGFLYCKSNHFSSCSPFSRNRLV